MKLRLGLDLTLHIHSVDVITRGSMLIAPTLAGDQTEIVVTIDPASEAGDIVQFFWTQSAVPGATPDDTYTIQAADLLDLEFTIVLDLPEGTLNLQAMQKRDTSYSAVSNTLEIVVTAPPPAGISFVGSNQANATSIAIPAHQAGDVIIITAFRNNLTAPTIPGTFTEVYRAGLSGVSIAVGRRVAAGSSEVSETWTSASILHVAVYRGCNTTTPIGVQQARNSSDLSMEWGGLTGMDAGADSWVLGAGVNAVGEVTGLPTDQTSRQATTGTVDCRTWDSNGPLASYAQQVTNFSVGRVWRNVVYELLAA